RLDRAAAGRGGEDEAKGLPEVGPGGHATWGDYLVTVFDHTDVPVAGSYGDDYLAGGPADDMIFGELGDDTAQGDGSIDYVAHRLDQVTGLLDPAAPAAPRPVRAYRAPHPLPGDPT